MSDTPSQSPSDGSTLGEVADAVTAAKAEIAKLLDDLKLRKSVFEGTVESSTKLISEEAETIKAAKAAFKSTVESSTASISAEIEKAKGVSSQIDALKK